MEIYAAPPTNVMSDKRQITLKVKEGMPALKNNGIADPRLFSGKNNLIAYKDTQFGSWRLRFEMGQPPAEFDQNFTSFPRALDFARRFFDKRNVEITEIKDIWD